MSDSLISAIQDFVSDMEPVSSPSGLDSVPSSFNVSDPTSEAVEHGNERLEVIIQKQNEQISHQREQLARLDEHLKQQYAQLSTQDKQLASADRTIAEIRKSSFQANIIGIIAIALALLSLLLQMFN